jgi:GntR family transcriptional regulator/MocR family aminotransferase
LNSVAGFAEVCGTGSFTFQDALNCGSFIAPILMELAIPLSENGEPLYRQVYASLRRAILSGNLPAGEQLPSTRDLAEQLGISRTVTILAYDHLLAEGFVEGRRGSGTYVSSSLKNKIAEAPKRASRLPLSRFGTAVAQASQKLDFPHRPPSRLRYDFAFGRSDMSIFPFEAWRRILIRYASKTSIREVDYGPPAGIPALREAICHHLRRSRAVVCDPSEVIVVNGAQQAIDLVVRVLIERGASVAIEDPQYQGTREVLRAAGARLVPVPVDRSGLDPARLPDRAKAVFVTPSHQFPTGAILPLDRRLSLIEWAQRKNAIIIENDYDGEFHYEGGSLESLQGLDAEGRTIYIGTFSRTIFPALRIGYLVVPKSLATTFTTAKWLADQHSVILEQKTLAEFITSGRYERHLRRLRRRNADRREALLSAIDKYLTGRVEVSGEGSGTHVILWLKQRIAEADAISKAASQGVGVYPISNCYLKKASRTGLMLGYTTLNEDEIREGIRLLSAGYL